MRFIGKVVELSVVFCFIFGIGFSQNLFSDENNRKNLIKNPSFEKIAIGKDGELLSKDWYFYNKECSWHEMPKGKGMSKWRWQQRDSNANSDTWSNARN